MGLDSDAAGGIDCATMLNNYKGRLIYNATNNDLKMHVNGNASPSQTLNNSTLTPNNITCGPIWCTGSGTKPTAPTTAGVYIGLDSASAGGIDVCASNDHYICFRINWH